MQWGLGGGAVAEKSLLAVHEILRVSKVQWGRGGGWGSSRTGPGNKKSVDSSINHFVVRRLKPVIKMCRKLIFPYIGHSCNPQSRAITHTDLGSEINLHYNIPR